MFEIKDDLIIDGRSFAVFHSNKMQNKIDDVIYQRIDFKFSSDNDLVSLYDEKGDLVDSVSYYIKDINNSYSRNIPSLTFENETFSWQNNSDITIGYHNSFYTDLIANIKEDERKRKTKILFYIISGLIILMLILYVLYRKRVILRS
mgnify:CR=1 FL=1